MDREIYISYSVSANSVAGQIAYGGSDSRHDISMGIWAARTGIPRLLRMFKKYGITTTWYIPGIVMETFKANVENIVSNPSPISMRTGRLHSTTCTGNMNMLYCP